jgi:hypothetical protein
MNKLRIISYGSAGFGEGLRGLLGDRLRIAADEIDCVGEAGSAEASGCRAVLLVGPDAQGASEALAKAIREVAPRAILLCDGGGTRLAWCDGVYDPDESPTAFVERLELLWLLGLPKGPSPP